MNSSPPIVPAIGATIVSAVRSPCASESAPAMRPPKNPPIRKMNTGMSANACVRMRYGATAPTIGPTLTNAALVHALGERDADEQQRRLLHAHRDEHEQAVADDERCPRGARPAPGPAGTGGRRSSPAIGIATSDASAVSDSIQPRVNAP